MQESFQCQFIQYPLIPPADKDRTDDSFPKIMQTDHPADVIQANEML